MSLEQIIRAAIDSFARKHEEAVPRCRERELVSRFAFGHLVPRCRPGTALFDPRQLGIEVAVPQRRDDGVRRQPDVCKDLVIWPGPDQTCWDARGRATHFPAAVLEWKSVDRRERPGTRRDKLERQAEGDLQWLEWFTSVSPTTEGYFVLVEPQAIGLSVAATRVAGGVRQPAWYSPVSSTPQAG